MSGLEGGVGVEARAAGRSRRSPRHPAILDGVNAAVGILVGLATLVYIVIRIRKELRK